MGKVVITLDVPDGMEEIVKSILEREAKLLFRKLRPLGWGCSNWKTSPWKDETLKYLGFLIGPRRGHQRTAR